VRPQDRSRVFLIRCSFVEIYNEMVHDLLEPSCPVLQIREHKTKGFYIEGLKETIISTPEEIVAELAKGEKHRHVGRTDMNARSSRSHTIFRIVVESRPASMFSATGDDSTWSSGNVLVGTLNLVDLAGSEGVRNTNASGQRQQEASSINKSLLALSGVIKSLADTAKAPVSGAKPNGGGGGVFINFRESKLTRVLQPSLAGNTRLAVICCISPSVRYVEESRSTLKFAVSAKGIKLEARVNKVGTSDHSSKLEQLQRELEETRRALQAAQAGAAASGAGKGGAIVPDNVVPATIHEQKVAEYERIINHLRAQILCGGTRVAASAEVADKAYESLARLFSAATQHRHNGMGRGKRHRETWCPTTVTTASGSEPFSREVMLASLMGASATISAAAALPVREKARSKGKGQNKDRDAEATQAKDSVVADPFTPAGDDEAVVSFRRRRPAATEAVERPTKQRRMEGQASVNDSDQAVDADAPTQDISMDDEADAVEVEFSSNSGRKVSIAGSAMTLPYGARGAARLEGRMSTSRQEALEAQIEMLQLELTRRTIEHDLTKNELQSVSTKVGELDQKLVEAAELAAKTAEEMRTLSMAREAAVSETVRQSSELLALETRLEVVEAQAVAERKGRVEAEMERDRLHDTADTASVDATVFAERVRELEALCATFMAKEADLTSRLADSNAAATAAMHRAAEAEAQAASLAASTETSGSAVSELSSQVTRLRDALAQAESQRDKLLADAARLSALADSVAAENASFKSKFVDEKAAREANDALVRAEREKVAKLAEDAAAATASLQAEQAVCGETSQRLATAQGELALVRSQLAELTEKYARAEEVAAIASQKADSLTSEVTEANEIIAAMRTRCAELFDSLREAENNLETEKTDAAASLSVMWRLVYSMRSFKSLSSLSSQEAVAQACLLLSEAKEAASAVVFDMDIDSKTGESLPAAISEVADSVNQWLETAHLDAVALNTRATDAESEATATRQQYEAAQTEVARLTASLTELEAAMQEAARTRDDMEALLDTVRASVAQTESAASTHADELRAMYNVSMAKQGEIEALNMQLRQENDTLRASAAGNVDDLLKRISDLENETTNARREHREKEMALENTLNGVKAVEQQAAAQTLRADAAERALVEARAEVDQLRPELARQQESIAELREVAAHLEEHKQALDAAVKGQEGAEAARQFIADQLVYKELKITELENELQETKGKLQETYAALEYLDKSVTEKQTLLVDLDTNIRAKDAELFALRVQAADSEKIIGALREKVAESDARLAAAQGERESLNAKMRHALEQLDSKGKEVAAMTTRVEQAGFEKQSTQAALDRVNGQVDSLRNDARTASARADAAEAALAAALLDADKELVAARAELATLKEQYTADAESLRAHVQELQSNLSELSEAIFDLKQENASKETRNETLMAEFDDLKLAYTDLTRAEENVRIELSSLRQAMAHFEALAASKGAELSAALERAASLSSQRESLQSENARLTERVEHLEKSKLTVAQLNKMMEIKKEHKVFKVQITQLLNERQQLKSQLETALSVSAADDQALSSLTQRAARAEATIAAVKEDAARARAQLESDLSEARVELEDIKASANHTHEQFSRQQAAFVQAQRDLDVLQMKQQQTAGALAALASAVTHTARAANVPLAQDPSVDNPSELVARTQDLVEALMTKAAAANAAQEMAASAIRSAESAAHSRAQIAEAEMKSVSARLATAERACERMELQLTKAVEDTTTSRQKCADLERSIASLSSKYAAVEKANQDLSNKLAEKTRIAHNATEEQQRAVSLLEKENMALMMELRNLRSAAMGGSQAQAGGMGMGGRPSVRMSLNPGMAAQMQMQMQGQPQAQMQQSGTGMVGGGRMSIAPSAMSNANGVPMGMAMAMGGMSAPMGANAGGMGRLSLMRPGSSMSGTAVGPNGMAMGAQNGGRMTLSSLQGQQMMQMQRQPLGPANSASANTDAELMAMLGQSTNGSAVTNMQQQNAFDSENQPLGDSRVKLAGGNGLGMSRRQTMTGSVAPTQNGQDGPGECKQQ
jgi:centromeric protein E